MAVKQHELNLLFIDFETTGLRPGYHEIIEVGAVLTTPTLKVRDSYTAKTLPRNIERAEPDALRINHYDDKVWREEAIVLRDALATLRDMGTVDKDKPAILVGYNVTFDWAFLQAALNHYGLVDPFHYHRLDVMSMAHLTLMTNPDLSSYSLREISDLFGIKNPAPHTAMGDVLTTVEVYRSLLMLNAPISALVEGGDNNGLL